MTQKLTILFDLDGTLVDTAPDLMTAHNHVMKKFGYPTKTLGELKNAVGRGAKAMMAKANGQWKWFDEDNGEKCQKYVGEVVNGKLNGHSPFQRYNSRFVRPF